MVVKAALLGANSRVLSDTRNEQEKYRGNNEVRKIAIQSYLCSIPSSVTQGWARSS